MGLRRGRSLLLAQERLSEAGPVGSSPTSRQSGVAASSGLAAAPTVRLRLFAESDQPRFGGPTHLEKLLHPILS